MMTFPMINRHAVGISALALAIVGLGVVGSMETERPVASLSEMTSAQTNAASASNSDFLSRLRAIPKNAFGSANPSTTSGEGNTLSQNDVSGPPSQGIQASDWTEQEWQIASKAVSAYRKVGKAAQSLSQTASSGTIWQPPEEIANQ